MKRDKQTLLDEIGCLLARISAVKNEISQLKLRKELILKSQPCRVPKHNNSLQRELAETAH